MASAPVVLNEVLRASPEKDNFMRLARLLNCGGTKIVRGYFDHIIPDLATKLSEPLVYTKLHGLRFGRRKVLTSSDWEKLFPSNSSTVVESKTFDLTLLGKLLRQTEISGLGTPVKGWNKLPSKADTTLEADIARLIWYRNELAHTETMEIEQDDFDKHWDDIKGALLRILGSYSSSCVNKCEQEIDNFRTAPLSEENLKQVRECFGCSEILVKCTTKLASTGLEWVRGGSYILGNYLSGILEYFDPMDGVEVVGATDGSVIIVLWVTDLSALERFWRIYETGELAKDFQRIFLTKELRQLAKDDEVTLDIFVSEEEYEKAKEQLGAKEREKLPEQFETKMRIRKEDQFEIFDGDVVKDGENRVQPHLAVITSKEQVEQVLAELKKKDPDVIEATHNIWAYRIFDAEKDTFDEHCDDDGDDNAGARVLHLLQKTQASDVMVVVSCWYETTAEEFGEVRFKYIQKSILDLFSTHGKKKIPPGKLKKFYEEIKHTPLEKTREQETPKFDILHGETIEDRKSTFQGHLADITSREQVDQVLDQLKQDRKIAKATYNMWACRIYDEKKKSYFEEGNDDGENYAGQRLLHLLQQSDAKNVVIIVTRWHGGIHLGNDRFKHINRCASDLLQQRKKPEETATASGTDPKATTSKKGKSKKEKAKKH